MDSGEGEIEYKIYEIIKKEFERSLFQELIEKGKDSVSVLLNRQYRMDPGIGTLISQCFYKGKLENGINELKFDRCWPWPPVIWCSTKKLPDHGDNSSNNKGGYDNPREIEVILKLLDKLHTTYTEYNRKKPVEIGVITGYKKQKEALERKIESQNSQNNKWPCFKVEINTVDAYQGREQDIIIYSVVRSNSKRKLGFLKDKRRLNVALSRAREQLFIIGNCEVGEYESKGINPFRDVLEHIKNNPCCCHLVIEESVETLCDSIDRLT
jgi:superfamily I DNA and/or RNA helicase